MDDVEEVLRSLPCSAPEAKVGLPTIVQLDLVDDGLKRNPEPREDFYRQYSITPERQYPITPRRQTPTEEENLQETKGFAARVAKGLKQFYAGRVLLRREEAEQHGDLEQDSDYWLSKADQWREFGTDCFEEWRKRKKKERKGEAEKGYADALLLSPAQSLSPALSGRVPSENTQHSKSPDINMHPSQPLTRTSQEPLEFTPGHNCDDPPTFPKGQKRKHSEVEDQEQKSLEHTCRSKRQRRGIETTQQKQEPVPDTKSPQGMGRTTPKLRSTKAHGRTRREILSPPPPPSDILGTRAHNHTGIRPPKQPTEKISSRSYRKESLSFQPNPGYGSDSTSNVTRRGKVLHTSLREDEERSLKKTNPRKRQRTGTPNPLPTNKLYSIPTPGEGQGKMSWKIAKARTGGASRLKELQASRVLPWDLRPRDPISYCEVGTRAA